MTTLDPITYNRIRPLKNQIRTNKLDLRYFITITYWYRNTDYYSVVEDNKLLKNHIKDFFGSMGMIFFIEKHTDPESNHFQGFHRHLVLEEIPDEALKNPSQKLTNFLSATDPEALFDFKFTGSIPIEKKQVLLKKVIKTCDRVPNGVLGLDVKPIHDLDNLLGYCTKQFERFLPSYEVIDSTNSDLDIRHFINRKHDGINWIQRHQASFARQN